MKLAEALSERKSIIGKMNQLKRDSLRAFQHPEDKEFDSPRENTALTVTTTSEIISLGSRLTDLICKINATNNASDVEINGKTMSLMVAIANKDARQIVVDQFKSLKESLDDSYRAVEHDCDIPVLNKVIEEMKEDIRVLDLKIQEANWKYDLI